MTETWVERERRTSRLVRACYDHLLDDAPRVDQLYALCRLTWITKGGAAGIVDNTRTVVAPALSSLTGIELAATELDELSRELDELDLPVEIIEAASRPVGFVNFYAAFRNTSRDWIKANRRKVFDMIRRVASARSDAAIRGVYAELEALPPLPRARAPMPAFNLITPMLACLDPRGRTPIINSRQEVRARLARLGLASASLAEQCEGLVGLIGQAGIEDAFALDKSDMDQVERALAARPTRDRANGAVHRTATTKPLIARSDEDVEYLRDADRVRMRKQHNAMTNALRAICADLELDVEEGADPQCMFDALVRNYRGSGTSRHLLIELKTDASMPFCRMAVGQLLDYRRHLPGRAAIDLAVLFPEKPHADALRFLGYVGVHAIWFARAMRQIDGDVRLGGS